MTPPDIHLHSGDLPEGIVFGKSVAVDCETMGLQVGRDRLCLVQLSAGDRVSHLVQFEAGGYEAPNLKALLSDPSIAKIFHFARFDLEVEVPQRLRLTVVFCECFGSNHGGGG